MPFAVDRPFPIIVKIWAGDQPHDYHYIKRSIPSLLESGLPPSCRVLLIDDCSTNLRIRQLMEYWAATYQNVELWSNPERMGPNRGQAYNFPRVVERFPDAELFMLCDDDVIYHPGWLQRLVAVHDEARAGNLVGVFSALNVPARPSHGTVQLPTSRVLLKNRQMALNWLIPRDVYDRVGPFRDVGIAFDTDYCTRMMALGLAVICLQPSYVQNIGYFGAYQSSNELCARDYVGQRDVGLIMRDLGSAVWNAAQRLGGAPMHVLSDGP